jgi:hypothetical protein
MCLQLEKHIGIFFTAKHRYNNIAGAMRVHFQLVARRSEADMPQLALLPDNANTYTPNQRKFFRI